LRIDIAAPLLRQESALYRIDGNPFKVIPGKAYPFFVFFPPMTLASSLIWRFLAAFRLALEWPG
jgi:hypothetical protein